MALNDADPDGRALADALDAIAPRWIRHDVRRISAAWIAHLHPDEAAIAARFVPARRAEFATGRASARRLFPDALPADHPILIGPRRAPVIPPGLHISISHCQTFVVAAGTAAPVRGLGVDIERRDRVTPDLAEAILAPAERADPGTGSLAAYFSAKEAAFKAIHGLIGRYIDFLDLELAFRSDRFTARPLFSDPALADLRVEGRVARSGHHILALAWAAPAGAPRGMSDRQP